MKALGRRRRPATDQARRLEVERCLAAYGLLTGPRGLPRGAPRPDPSTARRLAAACTELGGVFAAFALYLSTRADLFAPGECLELATLLDEAPGEAPAVVREALEEALAQPLGALFATFDLQPCESRLLAQIHRATLRSGEGVMVTLIRPGITARFAGDLALLDLLHGALATMGSPGPPSASAEVPADFQADLEQRLDLAAQAEALAMLAIERRASGLLRVPRVATERSAARVLAVEELGGGVLQREAAAAGSADAEDLGHRLAVLWLLLALHGRVFPAASASAATTLMPDRRLSFAGGSFVKTTAPFQRHLQGYFVAAANRDPDGAADLLLREVEEGGEPEKLRLLFRQAVPFRDGAWTAGADALADHLLLHWRLLRVCGLRPKAELRELYRSLVVLAATLRRLAPERDLLSEALIEVRLLSSAADLRDLAQLGALGDNFGQAVRLALQLPRDVDAMLNAAAGEGVRLKVDLVQEGGRNPTLSVIAFAVAAGALALLLHQLAGPEWRWLERAGAVLLAVLAVVLLRSLGSTR